MTKAEQRRAGIGARLSIPEERRAAFSAAICRRILGTDAFLRARVVFSYRSMPGEPDLRSLEKAGKTIAYPRCLAGGRMQALIPEGGGFIRGSFGIEEPDPARSRLVLPEDIDLVLVPCTAFDPGGGRLGMGGGYYDRYLPLTTNAFKLLTAFECQKLSAVAADALDVPMDAAVTEAAVYRF